MSIPDLLRRLNRRARRLYDLDHAHDQADGDRRRLLDWAEEAARYGIKVDR